MKDSMGWIQAAVAVLTMIVMLGGVYSSTQASIAVLNEKVDSLTHPSHKIVTEKEWAQELANIVLLKEKVSHAESDNERLVTMLTESHNHFTDIMKESTEVLRELSVHMAGVEGRLTGVEDYMREIRAKIRGKEAEH